jgi:hypothetical protein
MVEAQQQSMQGGSLCGGLTCFNNATCRNNTSDNNAYCECPEGFADVDCGRLVRECHYVAGDRSITAECYNGGTCLPELYIVQHNADNSKASDELLCDCSAAMYKGQLYVGKYCEMPLDDKSMCGSSSSTASATGEYDDTIIMDRHFCLHGGTCLETNGDNYYCDCATGFRGPHCEFAVQYDPACDLTCDNGGVCNFGGTSSTSTGTIQKQEHATSWGSRGEQHCLCPAGFAGVQCEHVVDVCTGGEQQQQQQENGTNPSSSSSSKNGNYHGVCLHGSTCDFTSSLNKEGKYDCACPASQNYIGGTCKKEHSRMELCNPSTPGVAEYAFGMAVAAFCVNGGKCKDVVVTTMDNTNQVYV